MGEGRPIQKFLHIWPPKNRLVYLCRPHTFPQHAYTDTYRHAYKAHKLFFSGWTPLKGISSQTSGLASKKTPRQQLPELLVQTHELHMKKNRQHIVGKSPSTHSVFAGESNRLLRGVTQTQPGIELMLILCVLSAEILIIRPLEKNLRLETHQDPDVDQLLVTIFS